jgi:DNA-binding IscR family transcriptional regulator
MVTNMAELSFMEQKVVRALADLGATSEEKMKNADFIQQKSGLPKGQMMNLLLGLVQKGVVKRVVREKASGYYIIKA